MPEMGPSPPADDAARFRLPPTPAAFHDRLDPADVLGLEPIGERYIDEGSVDALARLFQTRARHGMRPTENGRACDVLLFTRGGARPDGRGSRFGGAPFGTPGEAPTLVYGQRPRFLAQFDFGDSLDLFPKLPGDVLQIFYLDPSDPRVRYDFDDPACDMFGWRWRRAAELREPVGDAWKSAQPAALVRTWDDASLRRSLPDDRHAEQLAAVLDERLWKIGGVGVDNQSWDVERDHYRKGECLLAQIHVWQVPRRRAWPWIDHAEPFDPESLPSHGGDETACDFCPSGDPTVMLLLDARRRWLPVSRGQRTGLRAVRSLS